MKTEKGIMTGHKYRAVVVDPPWPGPVADWRKYPLVNTPKTGRKSPSNVYSLMSMDAIIANAPAAAEKSHLWLWFLPQHPEWAVQVAEAWGFRNVHVLSWCKPGFGTGGFQANTEYILLGRRGGPKDNAFGRMAGTHYGWPRSAQHSRKPDAFYGLVESVSPGPYLEMYARRRRPGWDAVGDQL